MTLRWITDADRQAEREHAEARQFMDELLRKYRPLRTMTRDEIANQPPTLSGLKIDPHRRTLRR
jgi:hypothetical protein